MSDEPKRQLSGLELLNHGANERYRSRRSAEQARAEMEARQQQEERQELERQEREERRRERRHEREQIASLIAAQVAAAVAAAVAEVREEMLARDVTLAKDLADATVAVGDALDSRLARIEDTITRAATGKSNQDRRPMDLPDWRERRVN
jgi:hypothetical protein